MFYLYNHFIHPVPLFEGALNTMAALSSRLLLALWLLFTTAVSATLNTLTSSGRTRSYWVRSPDEYDETKNYPVVIAFHGSSEIGYDVDGFAFEADIRLSLPTIPTKYSKDVSLHCTLPSWWELTRHAEVLRLSQWRRWGLGRTELWQGLCCGRPAICERSDHRPGKTV